MRELGLEYDTATPISVMQAIPGHSILISDIGVLTDESWNFPNPYGFLEIINLSECRPSIFFRGKSIGNADYRMFVDSSCNPLGTWEKIILSDDLRCKTISLTAQNDFTLSNTYIYISGKTIFFSFRATIPTISTAGWITIATIPSDYSMYSMTAEALLYSSLGTSPIVRDFQASNSSFQVYLGTSDSGKIFRIWGSTPLK